MWSRPSAYHYNVYVEGEDGKLYYNGRHGISRNRFRFQQLRGDQSGADRTRRGGHQGISGENPGVKREDIPTDLLTASGSGLDPHISPASAEIQIPRIAEASGLTEEEIEDIVSENTQGKFFGVFGEETVNVLKVNIEIAQRMGIL